MDWSRVPLSDFFRGPVLRTPEGLIVCAGAFLCWMFALLAWVVPEVTFIPAKRLAVAITLFALWPVCLFVLFVRVCGPQFRPRPFTMLLLSGGAAFPFWLAYR